MTTPILMSAVVGASASLLVAVLFNSFRDVKSDKKLRVEYPPRKEEVWE